MDIIIGAGATGLSYAAFSSNKCLILEADSEIGGYCKTVKQDGFVWDYSGHFFHFRQPEMEKFICENISPSHLLRCKKNTQIKYGDRYVDFPFQKNIHQLSKSEFIECLYDLFNNGHKEFHTFQEMLYCKFGRSIAEKFLIPYNEKLYACNLNNLDHNAMGRFFPYADKEDIIRNFKKSDASSYNDTFTYPRGGAIEYIESLFEKVPSDIIKLNCRVTKIDTISKVVYTEDGAEYKYDNLISTIPFPALLQLCGIAYDEKNYSWNKVLVFNLGFDTKGADRVNNWVYFPKKDVCFYRIGYYDNIFNDDRMSLYVELGFSKDEHIDMDYYLHKVLDDLKAQGIVSDEQHLVSYHQIVLDPAYVHISEQTIADVAFKKQELAQHHIYSIGRYGSWTYCSIEDGLIEAKNVALTTAR